MLKEGNNTSLVDKITVTEGTNELTIAASKGGVDLTGNLNASISVVSGNGKVYVTAVDNKFQIENAEKDDQIAVTVKGFTYYYTLTKSHPEI